MQIPDPWRFYLISSDLSLIYLFRWLKYNSLLYLYQRQDGTCLWHYTTQLHEYLWFCYWWIEKVRVLHMSLWSYTCHLTVTLSAQDGGWSSWKDQSKFWSGPGSCSKRDQIFSTYPGWPAYLYSWQGAQGINTLFFETKNCLHVLYILCSMLWIVIAIYKPHTICSSSLFLRDTAACNCNCTSAIHSTRQHEPTSPEGFFDPRCCWTKHWNISPQTNVVIWYNSLSQANSLLCLSYWAIYFELLKDLAFLHAKGFTWPAW